MKAIIEKAFIRGLSDTELVDKYNFMKREIESSREMTGLAPSRDVEFKYRLLKEKLRKEDCLMNKAMKVIEERKNV